MEVRNKNYLVKARLESALAKLTGPGTDSFKAQLMHSFERSGSLDVSMFSRHWERALLNPFIEAFVSTPYDFSLVEGMTVEIASRLDQMQSLNPADRPSVASILETVENALSPGDADVSRTVPLMT